MKNLFAAIRRAPKRTAALAMLAAVVIVPAALWAWGPQRPTYTMQNAATHVTFNSITNNPVIGDERDFVRIREANTSKFVNDVQLKPGGTYEVMVYYHNNSATVRNNIKGRDGKSVGIARGVTARVEMPSKVKAGSTTKIAGYISASNAKPKTVWDHANVIAKHDATLRVVPGSLKIAGSKGPGNGHQPSNSIFTSGALIGYNGLDGVVPGCSQYAGYVTYRFTVSKPAPKYSCDSLSVTKRDRNNFTFSTKHTVQNAKLKHVTYVVKNAAGSEVYRGHSANFTAKNPGKYTVESFITVSADGSDKTATSAACKKEFEVTPEAKPGITIDKKVDGVEHKKVEVNQPFTYQLVVKNTGNVDLKNATVTDDAPQYVQFLSADKGTITNNKWNYTIPELKVGQSVSFAIKAKATKEVEGKIVNTACVDAPQVPGTPDDCDDATVEVPPKPQPKDIKVCELDSKKIITIRKDAFDASKHSKNLEDCKEVPVVPEELPTTGITEGIVAFVGLGSLVASIGYYVTSRRTLG